MKKVRFDSDSGWGTISNAIIDPMGPDGKTWTSEIHNYMKGCTDTQKHGYQYQIGTNFPIFYKKKVEPIHKKRTQV